jgi:hypothetical protein
MRFESAHRRSHWRVYGRATAGPDAVSVTTEPPPAAQQGDDTLFLLFCSCHPDLAATSQAGADASAVAGLTTRRSPTPITSRRRRWRSGVMSEQQGVAPRRGARRRPGG